MIERGKNRQDQARILFDEIIPKKGYGGYFSIIAALRSTGQADIADLLENTVSDDTSQVSRARQSK